jgi:hypothetical protein
MSETRGRSAPDIRVGAEDGSSFPSKLLSTPLSLARVLGAAKNHVSEANREIIRDDFS